MEPPVPLADQEPIPYPVAAWDAGIEGEVGVRVLVNESGTVDSAVVHRSSGASILDSAAAAGAYRLIFEPARRGDEPVGAWTVVPVIFEKADSSGGAG